MNLREAKQTKSRFEKFLRDLRSKRVGCSVVEIAPGEDPMEYINEPPIFFTDKIAQVIEEKNKLCKAFREANELVVDVPELSGRYSVNMLLDKVKDIRAELCYFENFSNRRPKERIVRSTQEIISTITYDITAYRKQANALELEAQKISTIIDQLDSSIEVDYAVPEGLFEI